ncbi:MAG TPA: hypothetical protein VFN35_28350 [Ktedonobacteraceae bacterium]|nr:hypothetical protein [Ktedonobacteraceae bacterium]
MYLWDLQAGSLIQTLPLGNDIPTALAFHPQGLFLAVAPYDDDIQLWRLSDGSVQTLFSEEYASYDDCASYRSVAFSPDGQFLAHGSFEAGAVWLWHMPSGEFVQRLEPEEGRVSNLTFSPDSQLLVYGEGAGHPNDREMRVWDMHTRQVVRGFSPKGWNAAFRSDGRLLAAGNFSSITVWDVATRNRIQQLPAHRGRFYCLTFSPSGRLLVSLGDRKQTVRWWEVESGREICRMS